MRNDDPDLRQIEEWTGHRESRLSIVISLALLIISSGGFCWIVCKIAENLIAKP